MEEALRRGAVLAAVLALSWATPVRAAEKEVLLLGGLRARLESIASGVDGVTGIVVKDVSTGKIVLSLNPDEPFPTASVIKLAVLYELYRQADAGTVDIQEVTRPRLPRVAGGILPVLGASVSLTWRDLAVLMMGWSDNEATNLLVERLGMAAVNRRLDAASLRGTRLRRRMMDLEAARRGEENVATPSELVRLLEIMRAGEGLSAERRRDMLAVAALPKGSPFRDGLPEDLAVVDKPGELEGVRAVAALVELPGRPYIAVVMTAYLRDDVAGDAAIRDISAALYQAFGRLARSSELGRVISRK